MGLVEVRKGVRGPITYEGDEYCGMGSRQST
jgi:hypothetical protein